MKALMDQANIAKKAQDEVEEKAGVAKAIAKVFEAEKKEADAKMIEAQKELQDALAIKEAEIKVADEKAYVEGVADVKEDYKKQPYINWKEQGLVNEVRDQGGCECCWAIVGCAAVEALYNIKYQCMELFQLAPQELINCVKKEAKVCFRSSINEGFRYARQYGIRRELDCPFKAQKQHCLSKEIHRPALRIKSFKNIDKEDEAGIIEVLKQQPIGAGIVVTEKLKNYKESLFPLSGIYEALDWRCKSRPSCHISGWMWDG
ncbi:vignain-like [Camellia sinensis]|uniref:vignain-like n=1 Tax=Camellia sinensis TaxID=4442 RepID=UPI001035FA3D|nr:vignain-like [Camellia sinensis]